MSSNLTSILIPVLVTDISLILTIYGAYYFSEKKPLTPLMIFIAIFFGIGIAVCYFIFPQLAIFFRERNLINLIEFNTEHSILPSWLDYRNTNISLIESYIIHYSIGCAIPIMVVHEIRSRRRLFLASILPSVAGVGEIFIYGRILSVFVATQSRILFMVAYIPALALYAFVLIVLCEGIFSYSELQTNNNES